MGSPESLKNQDEEIDDSLYSRQRYVLGDDAMKKLSRANVFIMGMDGLGIEIAKNVVLSGVESVTIKDDSITSMSDLGAQFFLRKEDVDEERTRAAGCFQRLDELNPYVKVKVTDFDLMNGDLSYFNSFQCVVLVDCPLNLQLKVNSFCRAQTPSIKFISTSVFGVYSSLICDFGSRFEVTDMDGLEPSEFLVGHISKGNPAVITTLDEKIHDLDSGDLITLKEVKGMTEVNGRCFRVHYVSPYILSIDCDTTTYGEYLHGGIAQQKKQSQMHDFRSLQAQLESPEIMVTDFTKCENSQLNFLLIISVYEFLEQHGRKPDVATDDDYNQLLSIASTLNKKLLKNELADLAAKLTRRSLRSIRHQLAPLCATLGGIAAQEVLKAVTGKFSPLKEWLLLDVTELIVGTEEANADMSCRYLPLHSCIGEEISRKLANTRLFMVGCGAIGCEMLKNFALLGVGTAGSGQITVTDNDLIEKSNLNRQFLFRQRHIQKPKSVTAAVSAKEINGGMNIKARQDKVCPETECLFNDEFFQSTDIVVNALDNIEARRYVDSRCVTNKKPLIETGTLGPRGHVQAIVPFMTETYSSLVDPEDQEIPYCTLKLFPQSIDHTIQWARDKFGSCFANKPSSFNKFWGEYGTPGTLKKAVDENEKIPDEFITSMGLLKKKPKLWRDCVQMARIRFEKYFNHSAQQLLHVFPIDHILGDGALFWQSPKRPPNPIVFSPENPGHMSFIESTAKLIARIYGVKEDEAVSLREAISSTEVPRVCPSNKEIAIDDAEAKKLETTVDSGKMAKYREYLQEITESGNEYADEVLKMYPEIFEKDDDSNSHIDFITAASNLRAEMYSIEPADRYKTKRIAGKIIPAIATTTAVIAGMATIELIKVIAGFPLEKIKDCHINLAVPMLLPSTPLSPRLQAIKEGLTFSVWDRWDVEGNEDFTLQDFIDYFKKKYDLKVSMVTQGAKVVYIPFFPGHDKLPPRRMIDILKPQDGYTKYVDLTLGFECDEDDSEELPCPPVRYILHGGSN